MEYNPNNINEVGLRLGKIWEEQKYMLETIKKENRVFNGDEKSKYDAYEKEFIQLDEHKRTLESAKNRDLALASYRDEKAHEEGLSVEESVKRDRKVFEHFLRYGMEAMDRNARSVLAKTYGQHDMGAQKVMSIGANGQVEMLSAAEAITRGTSTQVAGTTTLGGYTVPQEWTRQIDVAMAAIGAVDDVALVLNTAKGGTLPYPKVDDTGVSGAIMTEGTAPAVSDMTFGVTNLADYTYTSYIIKVSFQLLNDEDVDLVPIIGVAIEERLRRGMNAHWTTGDGSSKPLGIVNTASEGKNGGDGGSLDSTDLYDLEASVDPKYAARGMWMFNNTTLTAIKKLAVGASDNRPLWVPSLRDGAPATILGYPYVVNQQMASPAAAAKYILFGDFKGYAVRKTGGGTKILRMNERFADALTVGFLGYARTDSDKISAGNPYKYLYRTAT